MVIVSNLILTGIIIYPGSDSDSLFFLWFFTIAITIAVTRYSYIYMYINIHTYTYVYIIIHTERVLFENRNARLPKSLRTCPNSKKHNTSKWPCVPNKRVLGLGFGIWDFGFVASGFGTQVLKVRI